MVPDLYERNMNLSSASSLSSLFPSQDSVSQHVNGFLYLCDGLATKKIVTF